VRRGSIFSFSADGGLRRGVDESAKSTGHDQGLTLLVCSTQCRWTNIALVNVLGVEYALTYSFDQVEISIRALLRLRGCEGCAATHVLSAPAIQELVPSLF
jgi:hypothetical protein